MAPIRRYLRITAYSVLEVRIYLDNPADAQRWLLHPREPVLPRVIEAVRPLVLPKLKEENERARKGGKKKGVKDVVTEDDFEASIFLTELSSPHSILSRHKIFNNKKEENVNGTKDAPLEVEDNDGPFIRDESEAEDKVDLENIPDADHDERSHEKTDYGQDDTVSISEDSADQYEPEQPLAKRQRRNRAGDEADNDDEKKKMGLNTTYDGFRIYGRILCLVVKRLGNKKGKQATTGNGQAMMEDWIASTQAGASTLDD